MRFQIIRPYIKKNEILIELTFWRSWLSKTSKSRRSFLKFLGVSTAGIAVQQAAAATKEKIKDGGEETKKEIESLKKSFEELDNRSKATLKLILALTGLDFFLD